ncbi:PREDICTED: uncharacterized protein C22orf15 homolog [Calidris pugnax]|uniref:uncharacterized protein C22orf15 homolog n=1 Tax=Calidris pugnax TaxID=198806 RepID=UPI00071D6EB4|nr:PREDICTED: uncharacterized protein C22orf15 homolog [Calidris pugnax]
MFIIVRYGDDCQEMVNLHCRLLILTAHLKRKCQCKPEDCIDLLDETGALMNLSKVENPASEFASKYLQERKRYILIRVVRRENADLTSYESLLENLGKHYPDLPDRLQKLSARQSWRRGSFQRKAQALSSTSARSRPTSPRSRPASPSRKSLRAPLDEDRT